MAFPIYPASQQAPTYLYQISQIGIGLPSIEMKHVEWRSLAANLRLLILERDCVSKQEHRDSTCTKYQECNQRVGRRVKTRPICAHKGRGAVETCHISGWDWAWLAQGERHKMVLMQGPDEKSHKKALHHGLGQFRFCFLYKLGFFLAGCINGIVWANFSSPRIVFPCPNSIPTRPSRSLKDMRLGNWTT